MDYPNSLQVLDAELTETPGTHITTLARRLIEGAKALDLQLSQNLGVDYRFTHIIRDTTNPPSYTHHSLLGAAWADNEEHPLEPGEEWNQGRRASNTGIAYDVDDTGTPINPFMNTGMTGRGVLGRKGPNCAVDYGNLILQTDPDTQKHGLYARAIYRKMDGDKIASPGGFIEYKKNSDGAYVVNRDLLIDMRTKEFFEEILSGSITLLPEYAVKLQDMIDIELATLSKARNGIPLTDPLIHEIQEQIETGLKMQQIQDLDPGFLARLREVVSNSHECFSGPMLQSKRNTNNAWIETTLSWIHLDNKTWNYIRGENPVFDYQFSAGDDASGFGVFKIDPWLIENSAGTHSALFVFMASSFVLDAQRNGLEIHPDIIRQLEILADYQEQQLKLTVASQPTPGSTSVGANVTGFEP